MVVNMANFISALVLVATPPISIFLCSGRKVTRYSTDAYLYMLFVAQKMHL